MKVAEEKLLLGGRLRRREQGYLSLLFGCMYNSAAAATAAVEDGRDSSSGVSAALERRTVGIVDSPGHQRLRPEALASAAASSVLIFFVDAADKPSLKGAAE